MATFTQNEVETVELVAAFENIYDMDIPSNPKTGDDSNVVMWFALLLISSGAVITLCTCKTKKDEANTLAE